MMHISSKDIWDDLEQELILFKRKEDIDPILLQRFDSLVNHFNGNMASGNQHVVIESIRILTSSLSQKNFYTVRNIDKEDKTKLLKINENLLLLDKVLVQEMKNKAPKEEKAKAERLPNINNDKSMKLFDKVVK